MMRCFFASSALLAMSGSPFFSFSSLLFSGIKFVYIAVRFFFVLFNMLSTFLGTEDSFSNSKTQYLNSSALLKIYYVFTCYLRRDTLFDLKIQFFFF